MAQDLTVELTKLFRAIAILSPTSYSFAGRVRVAADPTLPGLASQSHAFNPLVSHLQQQLYQYGFTQRFSGQLAEQTPPTLGEDNLVPAFSAANTSRERWDSGWQLQQVLPTGQIVAAKQDLTRLVWPGEFLTQDGIGVAPRVGSLLSVFLPRESVRMQPGFYFAFSEAVAEQRDEHYLVRFYWNIHAAGAATLMRLVTQELNRFQVPFRFKCLSSRASFPRLDAAVLFVNKRFYRITRELLVIVNQHVKESLGPETPLFTKRLVPGLGLAEDPGTGESFGSNRCRLVAQGIWNAYLKALQSEEARLEEVAKEFHKQGLTLDCPYARADFAGQYTLPFFRDESPYEATVE